MLLCGSKCRACRHSVFNECRMNLPEQQFAPFGDYRPPRLGHIYIALPRCLATNATIGSMAADMPFVHSSLMVSSLVRETAER